MEQCLHQMILAVRQRCDELEYECSILKGLLKPWPKEKASSESSQDENKNSQSHANGSFPGEKNQEPNPNVEEPALTAVEKQALTQLEKILHKAAQTRNSRGKLQKEGQPGKGVKEVTAVVEGQGCLDTGRVMLSQPVAAGGQDSGDSQCAQVTDRENSGLSSKGMNPCKKQSQVKANGKKVMPVTSEKGRSSSSSLSSTSVGSRPSSSRSTGRSSSSRGSHVPAHMKAPFKTKPEPAVRGPQPRQQVRQTRQTRPLQPGAAGRGQPLGSRGYRTLPSIGGKPTQAADKSRAMQANAVGVEENRWDREMSPQTTGRVSVSPVEGEQKVSSSSKNVHSQDIRCGTENSSNTPGASQEVTSFGEPGSVGVKATAHLSSSPSDPQKENVLKDRCSQDGYRDQPAACANVPKASDLKTIGPSLRLPSKLLKLFSWNNSLREKSRGARLTRKVAPVDPAQHFVDRLLQSQCSPGVELYHRVQALGCLHSHKTLLEVLKNLNLGQLSETSSLEELLRAKSTLEFILTKFAEMEESSAYLCQVQFRELLPVESHSDVEKAGSLSHWKELLSNEQHNASSMTVDEPHVLREHLAACAKWQELNFSLCQLQLLVAVTRQAEAQWWPVVEKDCRDPATLEAVHSLLTSVAQFMPAFVQNPYQYQS